MRKRDRDWMLKEIEQLFDLGVNMYICRLYADETCIPGAITNQMADKLAALIREHAPKIRAEVLALPETEQALVKWDRVRRGKD